MFNNIGNKIKILAHVICWIGFAVSLIIGLYLNSFLSFVIGCLSSWIGSFCLYGYGELIEKTAETAKNTASLNQKVQSLIDKYLDEENEF